MKFLIEFFSRDARGRGAALDPRFGKVSKGIAFGGARGKMVIVRPGALPLDPSKGGAFAILSMMRVWGRWPQRVQGGALALPLFWRGAGAGRDRRLYVVASGKPGFAAGGFVSNG